MGERLSSFGVDGVRNRRFDADAQLKQPCRKSTVSRVFEAIKDGFETWKAREFSNVALEQLLFDGSHFRMHEGALTEPVLAARGINTEGARSSSASTPMPVSPPTPGRGFLTRGSPGACGPAAGRRRWRRRSDRRSRTRLPPDPQTALCHRPLPQHPGRVLVEHQAEVKAAYSASIDPTSEPPGERSIAVARV